MDSSGSRLIQRLLADAVREQSDEPWLNRFPWGDPGFARRFAQMTDERSQLWGPPEPDVNRLMDIWKTSHPGDREPGQVPSVLDLTCGAGRHSIALAWLGCDVVGVDIGEYAIARAREKSALETLPGSAEFVVADLVEYEPPSSFNVVIMLAEQCVNFPPKELSSILRRFVGCLRPGGMMVLELPGDFPDEDVVYYEPGGGRPNLWSDWPYWELHLTRVDETERLVTDYFACYTEVDDAVRAWTNWRLYYTADQVAELLPAGATLRAHEQRNRRDWCIITRQ
ncbi:MAG: class I SAM-dependent methyltransferase [Dehalococcoidia bacterium]